MPRLLLALTAVLALVATGCDGGETHTATFTQVQAQVFTPSCATSGCHAGAQPSFGLDLSAGAAYTEIVGQASVEVPTLALVAPGQPDASYLYKKMRGDADIQGQTMPIGTTLSAAQLDLVRRWIEAGAPND